MSYKALLFCPEEKTARVVTQVLTELDFHVDPCNETFAAVKKLMAEHFDAIVVDCDNEQNAALLFKSAHNSGSNQKSLAVAVVEGQAGVAKAFRIGANLVLTKPINVEQSKGTLRVARGLLRKTDSAKPIAPVVAEQPTMPTVPVANPRSSSPQIPVPQVKIPASPKAPATAMPTASASSIFEVEQEPGPMPEPTEAAFLESMPDPLADTKIAPPATAPKESPWQPVPKPMSEPMTAALRRAAEVSTAPAEEAELPAVSQDFASAPSSPMFTSRAVSAGGAASAPAPAKEVVKPVEVHSEPETEAPLFTAVTGGGETGSSGVGGSKIGLILAAVVIVAAAGGYFAWTKIHSSPSAAPAPVAAKTTVQPQVAPTAGTPTTQPSATEAPTPAQTTPEQGPDITLSTSASPSATKTATVKTPPAAKQTTPQQAPIVVNGGRVPSVPTPTAAPEAAAPGLSTVTSNSGDQAISGIVTAPTTAAAQPAPQSMRISQGVAQGLLMKRVPPTYPPSARQARIEGSVEVLASIGKDGSITGVQVLSGPPILARAATDAVKQWKYKPYLLDGQPVEIQTQITVNFKLPQ